MFILILACIKLYRDIYQSNQIKVLTVSTKQHKNLRNDKYI